MSLKCSAHRRLPRTRNGAGSPWLLLSLHAQCSKATFGWFVLVRALGSGFGGLRKQFLNVRAYENYQVISCHDLLCGILGLSYMCSRCEGALVSSAYSRTPLNHIASPRCSGFREKGRVWLVSMTGSVTCSGRSLEGLRDAHNLSSGS